MRRPEASVADPARRAPLERARDTLLDPARLTAELAYAVSPYAESAVRGLRPAPAAWWTLRLLGLQEREEIRMPLRPGELEHALGATPSLATDPRLGEAVAAAGPAVLGGLPPHQGPQRLRVTLVEDEPHTSPASRPSLRSLARVVLRNFGDPARSAFS